MIPSGLTPRVSSLGKPVPLRGCLAHARALPIDVPLMRTRVPLTGRVVQEDSLWERVGSETSYGRWRPSSSARQFEATQHGRISSSVWLCAPSGGIVGSYLSPPGTRPRREGRHTGHRSGRIPGVLPTDPRARWNVPIVARPTNTDDDDLLPASSASGSSASSSEGDARARPSTRVFAPPGCAQILTLCC